MQLCYMPLTSSMGFLGPKQRMFNFQDFNAWEFIFSFLVSCRSHSRFKKEAIDTLTYLHPKVMNELPNNHRLGPMVNNGRSVTNLNWLYSRISEPSTDTGGGVGGHLPWNLRFSAAVEVWIPWVLQLGLILKQGHRFLLLGGNGSFH